MQNTFVKIYLDRDLQIVWQNDFSKNGDITYFTYTLLESNFSFV